MGSRLTSPVYVVGDNIDTDQIIPAQYLALVPTIPDEYEKLGSYAMMGLPRELYPIEFIRQGVMKTEYRILIAGRNFGCGSSREHAPISLGAAGVEVIVAESYARIFFRNSVATGELYPYEEMERLIDLVKTGDIATVDFDADTIEIGGKTHQLKPMGDVRPVIEAGGLFNYARKSGMISGTQGG